MNDPCIGLYVMSSRGLAVLNALLREFGSAAIAYVVTAADAGVEDDFRAEILETAGRGGVRTFERKEIPTASLPTVAARFAIGWKWMLTENAQEPLVVLHDSLLPRYRGFAPLVSALINAEPILGVTALLGAADYDAGPILGQGKISVTYPLKIGDAIKAIEPVYATLAVGVFCQLALGQWAPRVQDESAVTYSLWRDDADYLVDWHQEAETLRRFVDATGHPYRGAATFVNGRKLRILAATAKPDVRIENRMPGKVIFLEAGCPVVVCGRGLLRVDQLVEDQTGVSLVPWTRIRTRFSASAE